MTESQEVATTNMRWYVVHVYSGMEKSVQRALIERISRSPVGEQFGQVLVPTEEVIETRNNRRYVVERRMYAGYVLVQMLMNDDTWHLVKSTPKVTGFLGGNRPAPLADAEIANILQTQEQTADKPRPKISFEIGESVRLKEGAFADFNGRIEEVDYDKNRLEQELIYYIEKRRLISLSTALKRSKSKIFTNIYIERDLKICIFKFSVV